MFKTKILNFHSNWNTLIDNFKYSTKDFYNLLTEELQSNGIEKLRIKEVYLSEGTILSTKRLYLRLEWKAYQYDICVAPFGNGLFISWWLMFKDSKIKGLISRIPIIGMALANSLYPITYYKVDTASMFMSYAQSSVLKVLDDITKDKGVRSLSESERKPIMKDIFKR